MPRRKEPKRELSIKIDEESIRDAMALWVEKYHGIEIDIKSIVFNTEKEIQATATKTPAEIENDNI
jgi:hypothetical protein